MKGSILLINPGMPYRLQDLNIPMGLMAIGSYIYVRGYDVCIIDENNAKDRNTFLDRIERLLSATRIIGLSVMSAQIPRALAISKFIKSMLPNLPVIWGGIHPTLYPAQTAESDFVDIAVLGEGESVFLEVLEALEERRDLANVRGIAYFSNTEKKVIVTETQGFLDMNTLPQTEWDLFEDIRLIGSLGDVEKKTTAGIPIQTSRGCPRRCIFCVNSVREEKYRSRDTQLVVSDLESVVKKGVKRIYFIDEMFFMQKQRVGFIMNAIITRSLHFSWFASLRADFIRKSKVRQDFFRSLKESGFSIAGIGAESGSPVILSMLKKDIKVSDIVTTARYLHSACIAGWFSFMIGLPGETLADAEKTLRLLIKICLMDKTFKILGPQVYRPYPGSQLYAKCISMGMREPTTIEEWAQSPYFKSDISKRQKITIPWLQYPSEKLQSIIFYSSRINPKLPLPFFTGIVRIIFITRCRLLFFRFPIEIWLYSAIKRIARIANCVRGLDPS